MARQSHTLLINSASSTPSNTGSARSFHRDTEIRIKVLLYCDTAVLRGPVLKEITGPSKMSLLLKVKSRGALIAKPRLGLIVHEDDFGW